MADKSVRNRAFDPEEFLGQAGHGRTIATFRAKQKIFSQGDVADCVFYIQKGKVKVTVVSDQGKEAVTAVLGKHEFCGVRCMAGQERRMSTATAMTDCEVMRLEKDAIVLALHSEPAFVDVFLEHLLSRSIRAEDDLVDQLFNSSEKRLARALLLLANYGEDGNSKSLVANVSQETLAEMIGTTRSRVSHFMNKFRKLGLISYHG